MINQEAPKFKVPSTMSLTNDVNVTKEYSVKEKQVKPKLVGTLSVADTKILLDITAEIVATEKNEQGIPSAYPPSAPLNLKDQAVVDKIERHKRNAKKWEEEDNRLQDLGLPPKPRRQTRGRLDDAAFQKDAAERLRGLMFDPMIEMINLFDELVYEVKTMEAIRAGILKGTYSSQAHVTLLATKQKLVNDLMRYGY